MRELQLWETTTALDDTIADVRDLAEGCHFRDCRHDTEPRCAVRAAVADGRLAATRVDSYVRLNRELARLEVRRDELLSAEQKRRDRVVHRAMRGFKKGGS
jgi:ribosome biogenesis GTPase